MDEASLVGYLCIHLYYNVPAESSSPYTPLPESEQSPKQAACWASKTWSASAWNLSSSPVQDLSHCFPFREDLLFASNPLHFFTQGCLLCLACLASWSALEGTHHLLLFFVTRQPYGALGDRTPPVGKFLVLSTMAPISYPTGKR